MKYIRTKDGRIIETPFITDLDKPYRFADTIEELCDEFVVEDKDEFAVFHNLKIAKQTKGIIYGAIWIDWGLKYVAKLNDEKGDLELL